MEDEAEAPHRLFGHVDAGVNFSVGRYVAEPCRCLTEIGATQLPIFVGGTGLYFKALTEGLSDMPTVPDEVREAFGGRARTWKRRTFIDELSDRDPETARGSASLGSAAHPARSGDRGRDRPVAASFHGARQSGAS